MYVPNPPLANINLHITQDPPCQQCQDRNVPCGVQDASRRVRACAPCKKRKMRCSFASEEASRGRSTSVAPRRSRSKSRPAQSPATSKKTSTPRGKGNSSKARSVPGDNRVSKQVGGSEIRKFFFCPSGSLQWLTIPSYTVRPYSTLVHSPQI
jgi:hypothetical protein